MIRPRSQPPHARAAADTTAGLPGQVREAHRPSRASSEMIIPVNLIHPQKVRPAAQRSTNHLHNGPGSALTLGNG